MTPTAYRSLLMTLPIGLALSVPLALYVYYRKPSPVQEVSFSAPPRVLNMTDLEGELQRLTAEVGPRPMTDPVALKQTLNYLDSTLGPANAGWVSTRQTFSVDGRQMENLILELKGRQTDRPVILTTALDTLAEFHPDEGNQTATAALVSIAQHWTGRVPERSIRIVFTSNEVQTLGGPSQKGSAIYATSLSTLKQVPALWIQVQGLGKFGSVPQSQQPLPSVMTAPGTSVPWPDAGGFIAALWSDPTGRLTDLFLSRWRKETSLPIFSLSAQPMPAELSAALAGTPLLVLTDTGGARIGKVDLSLYFQAVQALEAAAWLSANY